MLAAVEAPLAGGALVRSLGRVEYADSLGNATVWHPFPGLPQLQGDRLVATDRPVPTLRVYRLHRQPPPEN